ncbi:glutathione peroxidase [Pedobacter sp. BS3]|uniref:glutathione peroxidase n=1 Tax=Pedobacter sp. BS3 TaxID=2567937 RepID=UPI0011EDCBEA|nr:glutathione peroxidase [Pedobacter sp. BS3]TZF83806.1 glutathione peroxidase [Pedobacter sp. BS3]
MSDQCEQKSIYQFTVKQINGKEVSLSEFKDKVLLIVNTASECGFTPQLKDLENLRKEFAGSGFEVLAFPSNDFGRQEPLPEKAISKFCKINFGINYPLFEKVHVRGKHTHPLFKFLSDRRRNGKLNARPRWNFHKYLVNRHGEVETYFYPFTRPNATRVRKRIQLLLQDKSTA